MAKALDALDASVIDYLLKPFTDERFQEALQRAGQFLKGRTFESWRRRKPPVVFVTAYDQHAIRAFEVHAIDGVGGTGAPRGAERFYLGLAPLPALLTLVAPAVIGFATGFDSAGRSLINRLSWTGVGLSVVLSALGLGLLPRC
jgi:hypothetical protein